jgi:hypothetical protein
MLSLTTAARDARDVLPCLSMIVPSNVLCRITEPASPPKLIVRESVPRISITLPSITSDRPPSGAMIPDATALP